jgi:hypothetical protein
LSRPSPRSKFKYLPGWDCVYNGTSNLKLLTIGPLLILQSAVIINLCIIFSYSYNIIYIFFLSFFFVEFLVYQLFYQMCTARGVDLSVLVKYTTLVGASIDQLPIVNLLAPSLHALVNDVL